MRTALLAMSGLGLAIVACSGSDSGVRSAVLQHGEGARRMYARLSAIAHDTEAVSPWLNTKRAESLRASLAGPLASRAYLEKMPEYAGELLKAGRTAEAIKALRELERYSTAGGTVPLGAENATFLRHQLAVAYLRLGEQENCLQHHNAESCLLPIR